jgi:hypothetical protein
MMSNISFVVAIGNARGVGVYVGGLVGVATGVNVDVDVAVPVVVSVSTGFENDKPKLPKSAVKPIIVINIVTILASENPLNSLV